MKFFLNDEVYVHLCDLEQLFLWERGSIPQPIFQTIANLKMSEKRLKLSQKAQDEKMFRLAWFRDEEAEEYLRERDWIVDFSEVEGRSRKELKRRIGEILEERQMAAKCLKAFEGKIDQQKWPVVNREIALLEYKAESIEAFILYRLEDIEMELPRGIEVSRWKCE